VCGQCVLLCYILVTCCVVPWLMCLLLLVCVTFGLFYRCVCDDIIIIIIISIITIIVIISFIIIIIIIIILYVYAYVRGRPARAGAPGARRGWRRTRRCRNIILYYIA